MRIHRGYSIVELMVVVLMLAIVVLMAAPSFSRVMSNVQLDSEVNQIVSALSFARSEAVINQSPITICPLDEQSGSFACATDADWKSDWLVFRDTNNNRQLNVGSQQDPTQCEDNDECMLKIFTGIGDDTELVEVANKASVTFDGEGKVDTSSLNFQLSVTVPSQCNQVGRKVLELSDFGRLKIGAEVCQS